MNKLPKIRLVDNRMEGKVFLPIWNDFRNKYENSNLRNPNKDFDGEFDISIGGDILNDNSIITTEHVNAYNYLRSFSEKILYSILIKLLSCYKNLQIQYGYDEDKAKDLMPNVDDIEQFKPLIELSKVHIMQVSKDHTAYVGYEFRCSWDDEHGIGFMTHRDRIIDFGGSDTAFLTSVAEKDPEHEL